MNKRNSAGFGGICCIVGQEVICYSRDAGSRRDNVCNTGIDSHRGYLAVILFPGPIFGVIFGLAIFGLGVAKGTSSVMAARKAGVV